MLPDWLMNSCPSIVSKATKCQSCASVVLMRNKMGRREGLSDDFMVVLCCKRCPSMEEWRRESRLISKQRRRMLYVRKSGILTVVVRWQIYKVLVYNVYNDV